MASDRGRQDMLRIDLEEAKRHYDFGTAKFVDVRRASAYERAHIPGALSIPVNELPQRLDELPRGQLLIFY